MECPETDFFWHVCNLNDRFIRILVVAFRTTLIFFLVFSLSVFVFFHFCFLWLRLFLLIIHVYFPDNLFFEGPNYFHCLHALEVKCGKISLQFL